MKVWRKKILVPVLIAMFGVGVQASAHKTLFVYVGAGIKEPVVELATMYEKKTGTSVQMTFNNSGALVSQLSISETGDVFMPGSLSFIEKAKSQGFISAVTPAIAYHVPVIVVPAGNPAGIKSIRDFAKPGIHLVLPDKEGTALGKSAFAIFKKLGISADVEKNILSYGETPQKVISSLLMGLGDAGIVDFSNTMKFKGKLETIVIDPSINEIEILPCAVLSCTKDAAAANEFMNFVMKEGPAVFTKYGFKTAL
jgi:molybdate transport system substrate-binding protein